MKEEMQIAPVSAAYISPPTDTPLSVVPVAIRRFEDFFKIRKRKRIRKRFLGIFMLFAMCTVGLLSGFNPALAVYYNGQQVGAVADQSQLQAAITQAEGEVSQLLGVEVDLGEDISCRQTISYSPLDIDQLAEALMDKIYRVKVLYVLSIDGVTIGATANRSDIDQLLLAMLDANSNTNTVDVSFAETISIRRSPVVSGTLPDIKGIAKKLTIPDSNGKFLLNVVTTERVSRQESLTPTVEIVQSDEMYKDQTSVVEKGKAGSAQIVEIETKVSGEVVSSFVVSTNTLQAPVSTVIEVGTRDLPRWLSKGTYIWPAVGPITSEYGYRDIGLGSPYHQGIDIGANYYSPVYAADGGVVVYDGWSGDYGYLIKIKHDNGDVTWYAHNSVNLVTVGDKVAQGDVIARIGDTGLATGPHCHFEYHPAGGDAADPATILPAK